MSEEVKRDGRTSMIEVPNLYRNMSDSEWSDVLKRSVSERSIDGFRFPGFPDASIQEQFVGSAYEASLGEAFNFYTLFKSYSTKMGAGIDYESSRILDFGCGWGRFLRFFWRDIKPDNLHGVDIDPDILDVCKASGISAVLDRIYPTGILPFSDNYFSHVFAYSVFTHLPEQISSQWLREISRVCKPRAVFICTTEPRRFLDHVESIPADTKSGWALGLKRHAGDVNVSKQSFDQGNFVYIPTGGGAYRDSTVYGDAVIPLEYIRNNWTEHFNLSEYIDDASRFWQAVVVCQKR